MIRYLIIDDEPQARKLMQTFMEPFAQYQLAGLCESAIEAYDILRTEEINLIFLDIKMPVITGTEFLRSLKKPPMVIFTTAYQKYAMEGFELNVIDYLLKPIALPRLISALEKVQSHFNANRASSIHNDARYLFVKAESKLIKINMDDIFLIEGMQNYIKIHLQNKVMVAAYTMAAFQEMLPQDLFLRIHRSFIVPLTQINTVNGNIVETPYRNLPIGATYRNDILERLTRHK